MTAIGFPRRSSMKAASIWCPAEQSSASMRLMGRRSSRAELPVEPQVVQVGREHLVRVARADPVNKLLEHPVAPEHLADLVVLAVLVARADSVAVAVAEEVVAAWEERIIHLPSLAMERSSTSLGVVTFM